jgi:hypothetical protein
LLVEDNKINQTVSCQFSCVTMLMLTCVGHP